MASVTQAEIDALKASGEFDADWYLETYRDVAMIGMDPAEHYLRYGRLMDRKSRDDLGQVFSRKSNSLQQETSLFKETHSCDPSELDLRFRLDMDFRKTDSYPVAKVSVIVTNFNNEKYLARAINSARSQTGVEVEVVVVDDGSTDRSVEIALEIARRDERVKVYSLLQNFGAYFARNYGVMKSTGQFIALVDSDDILHPDRLSKQICSLLKRDDIAISLCHLRRWSEDFSTPLQELKVGENTLVVRRSLFDEVGFFDTVKMGADTEFRKRVERVKGKDSLLVLTDELYFLRTLSSSLTTSGEGKIYTVSDGNIEARPARVRSEYQAAFLSWHKSLKGVVGKDFVSFPQYHRSFDLPDPKIIASPFLGQLRVGYMATFPERRAVLEKNISSILEQLDVLNVYLNDYDEIPDFLMDPKIRCTLSKEAVGDLRDNGKFYKIDQAEGYVFTLDDDIVYPPNYVSHMVIAIEMFQRSVVVGVHGVIFSSEYPGYMENRTVFHFSEQHRKHFVDLLGTGTVAFHSSTLKIALNLFESKGVCDLWFAKLCSQQYVPLLSIDRPKNWLIDGGIKGGGTRLFLEAKSNSSSHNELYQEHLRPLIQRGQIRKHAYFHFLNSFGLSNLVSAGFSLDEPNDVTISAEVSQPLVKIALVVNGWNCDEFVHKCLRSVMNQRFGRYLLQVNLLDDGSTDCTYDRLLSRCCFTSAGLFKNGRNMGAAYTRNLGINAHEDSESVVVLLDLDDELRHDALDKVSDIYLSNKSCFVTCGNWRSERRVNPLEFYSPDIIDGQLVRHEEQFRAAPLRTFK